MRIKSYFSGTVEAALALARRELGDDAFLLNSRPTPPEARQLGAYEVVFGVEGEPSPLAPAIGPAHAECTEGGELFRYLIDHDFDPSFAREIEGSIGNAEASEDDVWRALSARLPIAVPSPDTRATVLVGSPGAGKTTTLVKLAIRHSVTQKRPVRILSLDSRKIGAENSLRTLAVIAGLSFDALDTPESAAAYIDRENADALYFIDTPGFSSADMHDAQKWAAAIDKIPHREVHLVVTATARTADLTLAAERYRMFAPQRLIFTRLDETSTMGGVLSLAARAGQPVSWLGTGQSIPEDLEAAAPDRILARMFGRRIELERTQAAAAGRAL